MTALTLGVVLIAFMLVQWIHYRGVSKTFVEYQVEREASPQDNSQFNQLADSLASAYGVGGWSSVELMLRQAAIPAAVVDLEGLVRCSSAEDLAGARAEREGSQGTLRSHMASDTAIVTELELLLTTNALPLSHQGAVFAHLLALPEGPSEQAGRQFADEVWRSTLTGLALILLGTGLVTWLLMRRALSPIDQLTTAVAGLAAGVSHRPIKPHRASEFRVLFDTYNRAVQTLTENASIRRRLVADIAHELRTPLTNLGMQMEALGEGMVAADCAFVGQMRAELAVLERLVSDFQQLAQSDSGQLKADLQPIDLDQLIQETLVPLAERHAADLETSIPLKLWVQADPERMRQVFGNLLENAKRHRDQGLRIRVLGYRKGDRISLHLSDNGPGVAPEDQPHIFERLYRGEKSRNRRLGGAGLGLAIVRALLGAMDASIRYDEKHAHGAAFVIEFKAVPASGEGFAAPSSQFPS